MTPEEKRYFRGHQVPPVEHPYADLQNKIKALACAISQAVNDSPADSALRAYLLAVKFLIPRDRWIDGKRYRWQCVGLRPLYRVVNLAGKRRRMTVNQIKGKWLEAGGDEACDGPTDYCI